MTGNILALLILSIVYLQFVTSTTRNHCDLIRCGNRRGPVCATDGKTYRSMCHFIRALCIKDKAVHLRVQRQGFCRKSFVCSLPKDGGRCHLNRRRYYFNRQKKRCLPFRYGGCYGNRNNFVTYRACRRYCGRHADLDELDKYETPTGHMRQEPIRRYDDLDLNGEEIEDYNERKIDEIGQYESEDEDQGRNERRFREEGEGELEEDDGNEVEYQDAEDQQGDIEDGNEDNIEDYDRGEDEDAAFENETEYVNKMKNERESRKETRNKVDAVADVKRLKLSTKSKYPSCEKGLCELNITPVGCFRDNHQAVRPLPHLVDSHRDTTSHAHHGVSIDWKNFESTIRKLACDCVRIARKKNYTHIGLQNYGECWAGNVTDSKYAINGKSDNCVNGTYKPCENGTFCIGKQRTNFVYKIEPTIPACHVKYENVGCFQDPVKTDDRPMPELLDSHRDRTSNSFHGLLLDWKNYRTSLKILIDHCAQRTKSKGYSHFGIQHYGECWSGKEADRTYSLYGNSTNCVNADYEKCNSSYACQCAGKENANFVYRLK